MSRVAKRITKNTFYILLPQIINKMLGGVFIIFGARLLGAKAYGAFTLISSIIFISSIFTNLGIKAMIIRKISKDKMIAGKYMGTLLSIKFSLALLAYIIVVLFANFSGYSYEIKVLLYIAGSVIIFNVFAESFETMFIAYEKMKAMGIFLVLSSLIFTVFSIAAMAIGYKLKTVFLLKIFTAAGLALIMGWFIHKRMFKFRLCLDRTLAREIIIESLPFTAALILMILNSRIDVVMLSLIKGPIEGNLAIGYYAPAYNMLMALMILPLSLNKAMLPMVSQKIDTEHETVRKSIEKATIFIMITISFPIILATTFFSEAIISLLFGPEYIHAASALKILGWAYALYALDRPFQSILGTSKDMKEYLPLLLGIFIINVALNFILIPKYSYVGASAATLVSFFIGFTGRFYFLRRILRVRVSEIKRYLRFFFILGGTLGSAFLLRSFVSLPVLAILTLAIYIILFYMFNALEKEEIVFVTDLIRKKGYNKI